MQTLGVGLIARNAGNSIRVCIESVAEYADQIVVVLAGESTDNTEKEVREASPKVEIYNFDWIDDFAAARNFCFSKLNTDWALWVDADDEVYQPENLKKLMTESKDEVGAIWLSYHYAMDEFGNVTTLYERERLLRSKFGWVWRGRLHETVSPLEQCVFVRSDEVIIRHNHLAGVSRNDRNFKILDIMYKEDPNDKRIWLYLGHQNFAAGKWQEAAEWYLKFGSDPQAVPIERYQALCYCSKSLRSINDKQAIDVALMAIELFPDYKDAYLDLAHSYMITNEYEKVIHWVKVSDLKGLIKEPPHVIFINPMEYSFNKLVLMSECYMKLGDMKTAIDYMIEAYKIRPMDELKHNVEYLGELHTRQRTIESIKTLATILLRNKEYLKLHSLLEATPYWFRDLDEYKELEGGIRHHTSGLKDEPQIVEAEDKSVLTNIGNSLNPVKLLETLDEKHDKVTVFCPFPTPDSKQINAYSQRDLESLIMTKTGRHIINLQREPTRLFCEYDKNVPKGLAVRIFLGQGLEYWTPKTIKEVGCGGSETAMAMIARELASKNCQPILYAMDNQIWDGVIYREYKNYHPSSMDCALFISSRVPDVFYDDIKADQKWLWFHDIHCGDRFSPEIATKVNAIIALSQWHANQLKRVYPFLKDSEIIDLDNNKLTYDDQWTGGIFYKDITLAKSPPIAIIGNAINAERFKEITETRIPHRFIWCSAPDRGLEEVLTMWPLIRKAFSDAELKIFYGWEYFNSSLFIPEQRDLKKRLLKLIHQEGVEWCGRIGQDQIVHELMKADIMLYPPHNFRETYGIAFLEAQAAGVLCFYRKNGALGETIGNRGIGLELNAKPENVVEKIVETLADKERHGKIRERARKHALQVTWEKQAEKVLALYRRLDGQNNGD